MPTSLIKKLQIKPGVSLLLQNAPEGYLATLQKELEGINLASNLEEFAAILLFVNNLTEVSQLAPAAIAVLPPEGLFWIAYPKGTSGVKTDVNRDRLWNAITPMTWRPVRQIALDEIWSAVRFRPMIKDQSEG